MLICFVGAFALAMQISAQAPPTQILQIYRQHLKSGTEAAFGKIEEETARICAQLGCPHPYLAIESLTGSKEVWFFNGYKSSAEKEQVYLDYAKNAPLMS